MMNGSRTYTVETYVETHSEHIPVMQLQLAKSNFEHCQLLSDQRIEGLLCVRTDVPLTVTGTEY